MRNLICIAALLVSTFMLPIAIHAQQSPPPTKPANSPSQEVLEQWNDIGRKLIAMAEDFPEDKYDFKPNAAERTFAQQLLHAAGVNYFFTNAVLGEKLPTTENPPREQYKTKADVVAFVKKSFADGAAAIKKRGDKGMGQQIVNPYGSQYARIGDLAYAFIEHSGEHYGQLVVYYRVSGLVPPESRPKK